MDRRPVTVPPLGWTPPPPEPSMSEHVPHRVAGSCLVVVRAVSGGCGTSTLAAAVALRGALTGRSTVLVDLARAGAPADVVTGVEQGYGVRWDDLLDLRGEADGSALLALLPVVPGSDGSLRVLARAEHSAPERLAAVVISALARAADLVVVECDSAHRPLGPGSRQPSDWDVDGDGGAAGREVIVARGDVYGVVSLGRHLAGRDSSRTGPLVLRVDRRAGAASIVPAGAGDLPRLIRDDLDIVDPLVLGNDRSMAAGVLVGRCPGLAAGPVRDIADLILAELLVRST